MRQIYSIIFGSVQHGKRRAIESSDRDGAGEPVADNNDLFGATVQMAARLCSSAEPDTIYVTEVIRSFAPDEIELIGRGSQLMKGFSPPTLVYEVSWK